MEKTLNKPTIGEIVGMSTLWDQLSQVTQGPKRHNKVLHYIYWRTLSGQ